MFFDKNHENGSAVTRKSKFWTSSVFWSYFAEFFPITLHKTVNLAPAFSIPASTEPKKENPTVSADTDVIEVQLKETSSDWDDTETREQSDCEDSNTIAGGHSDEELEPDAFTETEVSDNEQDSDENEKPHSNGNESLKIIQSSSEFPRPTLLDNLARIPSILSLFKSPQQPTPVRTGKQYIFGYHPHGIIGMGAMGGVLTEGANWSKLFPGIPVSILTIANQFQVPLFREYIKSLGLASVSRRSCTALLNKGQSICIVLGGAQESLLARPGAMDLVLNKRKGFVKLAMAAPGTSLVPIFGFGENDLYDQVSNAPTSKLFQIQTYLKNLLRFTLPLIHARGIFNLDFGIIPYSRPLNLVVGKPIEIPAIQNPSDAQVAYYHGLYVDAVEQLFEAHKDQFHKDLTGQNQECIYQPLNLVA